MRACGRTTADRECEHHTAVVKPQESWVELAGAAECGEVTFVAGRRVQALVWQAAAGGHVAAGALEGPAAIVACERHHA